MRILSTIFIAKKKPKAQLMTSQRTPTFESELCWEYAPSVPSCDEHLGALVTLLQCCGCESSTYCKMVTWQLHLLKPSSWSLFIIPKINDFWQKTHQRISENKCFRGDFWKLTESMTGFTISKGFPRTCKDSTKGRPQTTEETYMTI